MLRQEFFKYVEEYVVPHGEPAPRDGRSYLLSYRAAKLLLRGSTASGRNSPKRHIAIFGTVSLKGEQRYHIVQADATERGGVKASSYDDEHVTHLKQGDLIKDRFLEETVFWPASDSRRLPRIGKNVIKREVIADENCQDAAIQLPGVLDGENPVPCLLPEPITSGQRVLEAA
jgi:hypothetical protein